MNHPHSAVAPLVPLLRLSQVPAPAKINLFLHITGQRPDGYHLLQSVFMLIDWCDVLNFELRTDGQIERRDLGACHPMALPAEDLCVRAARALQSAAGCRLGATIELEKRLPAEAGLGGGSSDAATCLLALNQLWALGLKRSELAAIGLQLGADVPFFIGGRNAWVEGMGEQLTPIRLPECRFVVVKPSGGAATQDIFRSPDLKRNTKTATIQGFAAGDATGVVECNLQALLNFGHNDLQPVAQSLCPEVGRCIEWLTGLGLQARMTGSGTAVFAPMQHPADLSGAPVGWTVRTCKNLDVHPLSDWCSD